MKKVISVILSTIILVSSVLCVDLSAMANQINITNRAEWLSQLVKTFDMTVESDNYPDNYFSDLSNDSPYYRDILVATEFGIVDIEAGDPVNPEGEVTREFAAQTLNFCLKYVLDKDDDFEYSFADYEQCEYPDDDQIAVDHGWFELDENNNFCPNQTATLDEAEIMIGEAKETIKADEVDEHYESTFEYQKGVVEIDKDSSFEFVDDNNLILYDTSYDIKTGTSFVAYVNEIPVTYTAKNVIKESDCLKIECVEPKNKEDIIKNVDMQAVSQISTEDFVAGKGFEVVEEPQSRSARFKSEKFSVKLKANLPLPAGNSVEFNVTLKNIVLSTKYNTKKDSFEAKLDFDYSFNFSGQFSSVAAVQDALDDFDSIGEIPIAGVGYFSFAPEFDITGSITHSNSYSATIGCSYDTKGVHNITSFKKKSFTITFEGAVKLGLKAEVGIKILIAKVGFYASIGVTAKGTASTNKNAQTNTDLYCLSLDAYLYFNLGVDITLGAGFISKDLVFEYEVFNKKNSPIKLGFHLENGKSVPACTADSPNKQKYVTKDSKYGSVTENDGSNIVKTSDFILHIISSGAAVECYTGTATNVDIPTYISGYKVVAIGWGSSVFNNAKNIKRVTIPDTVTSINQHAFSGCENLSKITLSKNLKNIGVYAFMDCSSLTNVVIPDNVINIGDSAFDSCKSLTSITIPNNVTNIGERVFNKCSALTSINVKSSNSYYSSENGVLFDKNKTKLIEYPLGNKRISYNIPDSVTYIGNAAFISCTNLTSVTIPNSVTYIGDSAFSDCSNLISIIIPESVTSIGKNAFNNCTSLKSASAYFVSDYTFAYCTSLKSVSILGGIVGNYGFFNCTSLENVRIPDGAKYIGRAAFGYCKNLVSINLSNTLQKIGYDAFEYCDNFRNIYYNGDVEKWCSILFYDSSFGKEYTCFNNTPKHVYFNGKLVTDLVIPSSITKINHYTFYCFEDLKSVKIDESVTSIGYRSFSNCKNLNNIQMIGVTEVNDYAFYGCEKLENVELPNANRIGNSSFEYCSNLKTITVSNCLSLIDSWAFVACPNISEIKFNGKKSEWKNIKIYSPNSLDEANILCLDGAIFKGKSVISIDGIKYCINSDNTASVVGYEKINGSVLKFPGEFIYSHEKITVTNVKGFDGCLKLKSVVIPNNVITVSGFSNCSNLTDILMPNTVKYIGSNAFSNCSSLKKITLPNSIISINSNAFSDCISLTDIIIPSSVTYISDSAFLNCESLTDVTLPDGLSRIAGRTFQGCKSLEKITLPSSLTEIGYNAFSNCKNLKDIEIPNKTTKIGEYAFYNCSNLNKLEIPNSVKTVGNWAFDNCKKLKIVKLSDSLSEISQSAFAFCSSLEEIVIPSSVKSIKAYAFEKCTNLTNVTLSKNVNSIGYAAFSNCENLNCINYDGTIENWMNISFDNYSSYPNYYCKKILFNGKPMTKVVLSGNITEVKDYTFCNFTDLKQVVISKSTVRIGRNAFDNCDMLNDVYYVGTESEWNSISVGAYNDNLLNATKHYNFVPCTEVEHNAFGEWKVVKNATCTEDGLRQRVCSFDNFVQTETLPALGHDFGGNAEYCKHGCGTRNPNYVPPTVTTQPATQPVNTTTVTEPQPTQAPTVVTTTNAPQSTTKAPAPTSSTTVAPAPAEPTTSETTTAVQTAEPTTQTTTKAVAKPKAAKFKKVKGSKKAIALTWAKVKGVRGYEIQLATDKKFKKNKKTVTIKKQKTTKTTVKKLKAKKKYFVRIRTYKIKKIKGKNTKVYSSWSKTKTVKTK